MSKSVYLLGVDPGLANMGWSVLQLLPDMEVLIDCGVRRTEKSNAKRKVLASDDNLRRAREMAAELDQVFNRFPISVVCAESMSFPRNSSAAAKMAMCWGSLATFVQLRNLPIVQSSPQEVKKVLCGNKSASKEEIGAAVRNRYGNAEKLLEAVTPSVREHAYDSVAAVVATLENSEVIRALRSMAA